MSHRGCCGKEPGPACGIAPVARTGACVLAAGGCGETRSIATPAASSDYIAGRPTAAPPPRAFTRAGASPAGGRATRSETPPLPPPRA